MLSGDFSVMTHEIDKKSCPAAVTLRTQNPANPRVRFSSSSVYFWWVSVLVQFGSISSKYGLGSVRLVLVGSIPISNDNISAVKEMVPWTSRPNRLIGRRLCSIDWRHFDDLEWPLNVIPTFLDSTCKLCKQRCLSVHIRLTSVIWTRMQSFMCIWRDSMTALFCIDQTNTALHTQWH